MGKCLWCDKELSTPEATVCPSCVFRPISEAVEEQKKKAPEGVDPNFDLSILGFKKNPKDGKRAGELNIQLMKASMMPAPEVNNMLNKVVKVKSRNYKDRSIIVDDLVLTFDSEGLATILEADAYKIDEYSRVRPGRLQVLREESPKKEVATTTVESKPTTSLPEVSKEPVVPKEKPAEKVKPVEKEIPKKKAPPKNTATEKQETSKKATSKE